MNSKCTICGWQPAIDYEIDGLVVCLCKLHIAEYEYKPDGFLWRHGVEGVKNEKISNFCWRFRGI